MERQNKIAAMKAALSLIFSLVLLSALQASDVNRFLHRPLPDGGHIKLKDTSAGYELIFKVDGAPKVIENPGSGKRNWNFQFTVENRRGVKLKPSRLRKGDLLLDPIVTVSGTVIKERGTVIDETDIAFLSENAFRVYYDRSGTPIPHKAFKVGDVLELYKRVYEEEDNTPSYEECGLETNKGTVLIENGTTLTRKHIAMINREPIQPVRVRWPVDLSLEFYLRIDWPEDTKIHPTRFWVKREGVEGVLYLLPYELKKGDVPIGHIVLSDGTAVCREGTPLKEKGLKNSIEAIEKTPSLIMIDTKYKKPIVSFNPINGEANSIPAQPGDIVPLPQNRSNLMQPVMVVSAFDLENVTASNFIYGYDAHRKDDETTEVFPQYIYFAHHAVPVYLDCVKGCDELLKIEKNLLTGKQKCLKCKRDRIFPPFVHKPTPSPSNIEVLWQKHPLDCPICHTNFYIFQAQDVSDDEADQPEIPPVPLNAIHPSRLRTTRIHPDTKLMQDAFYYRRGKKITVEKGTPITNELRKTLEIQPVSPLLIEKPHEKKAPSVQCPSCYNWVPKYQDPSQLAGRLQVDEIRKGSVAFEYQSRRLNKLELVVFGLRSEREPTTDRDLAKVLTFRRHGDEHFQDFAVWKLTKEEWKYLPRYSNDDGTRLPTLISGQGGLEDDEESLDDLLE